MNLRLIRLLAYLIKWMEAVNAVICYQPDVPQQQKTDVLNAHHEFVKETERE